MMRFRAFLLILASQSLVLVAPLASGQPKSGQTPADVLFQKAVKDMQAGHYNDACQALEASLKLEKKPGTLYALADCEATRGHNADALPLYAQYVQLVAEMKSPESEKHAERAEVARSQQKKLEAEGLFERAKLELEAGKIAEACETLNQSLLVDPKPGTLFSLADCEETRGRLGTALGHYKKYLDVYATLTSPLREKHAERAQIAGAKRSLLEAEAPRLKLVWTEGSPNDGLKVTQRDGEAGALPLGVEFVENPGELILVVNVPGKPLEERRIQLEKRAHVEVDLSKPDPSKAKDNAVVAKRVDAPNVKNPWRTVGIAAMGLGGAAILAGGVFGGLAMQQKDTIAGLPCTALGCPEARKQEIDTFHLFGNASTAFFVSGAAIAGTGILLFVLSPSKTQEKKNLANHFHIGIMPGSANVSVTGAF